MVNDDHEKIFSLILINVPLYLLIIAGPIMSCATFSWVYCLKLTQKNKEKSLGLLFNQSNPKWVDFYNRYALWINLSATTGIAAFFIIVVYVLWMSFWIMDHDILQEFHEYSLRLTLINLVSCFFAILYWSFFIKNIVGLAKIKREIKAQILTFDEHLGEHKIFSLLPCDSRIAKIQASNFKYLWRRIQRRIGNNKTITGKALFSFFTVNNLIINLLVPYLVLNAKEIDLNINPMDGCWYIGQLNMKFKDAEGKRRTPRDVFNIIRNYFASMSFTPNLAHNTNS